MNMLRKSTERQFLATSFLGLGLPSESSFWTYTYS